MISKKNIRYEGTLYSINEANATVALQNVRSFGTEGREKTDPSTTFVAPQDAVHPYLLFRGCDIKDLHVHERASAEPSDDPAVVSNEAASETGAAAAAQPSIPPPTGAQPTTTNKAAAAPKSAAADRKKNEKENQAQSQQQQRPKQQQNHSKGGRGAGNNRRPRKPNPQSQVGTGASLLNRKARGTVEGGKFFEEQCF